MNTNIKFFDEYFDSSYSRSNILSHGQYEIAYKNFNRLYKNILPTTKDAQILDIGCGAGHFLYYLSKKDYKNSFGIDLSRQQIDCCLKKGLKNAHLADAFYYLKEKIDFYDMISAHDVLEHIKKDMMLSFLDNIYKSLKPGGLFIVRVPNLSNPFSIDSRYSDMTHEAGFTSKSLYQILWVSGFRDIKILPPKKIPVHSIRNLIRKIMVNLIHRFIRFAYYIQDFSIPENLDKNLISLSYKK